MPRCLICGRRWAAATPRCNHEPSAEDTSLQDGDGFDRFEQRGGLPTIEGYRIGQLLGTGGFGIVVAAIRERDGLEVAIKTVHRDDAISCRRLVREAEALRAIGAPYVPELYDTGALPDGSPYLVIEKLTIPSLDSKLGDPMERGEFVALANPILTAVEATHDCGYVHRDLKPENIFVSGSLHTARLIDFGLTKSASAWTEATTETVVGTLLGTPVYMSPEQCDGRSDVDFRADIYSLGIVLYEMLTGRPPFFGKPAEVRGAHLNHRPPPASHVAAVSPAFDEVMLRCLAKEPERRFADVRVLRRALSEAMERESDIIRTPVPAQRLTKIAEKPQLVGLVLFSSDVGASAVVERLVSLGGHLVFVGGQRYVAAFGFETSGNPIGRAFESAQALVEKGLATRVVVDRDRARIHHSPEGARRVLTAAFRHDATFPRGGDPSGVLVTARAADGLGPLKTLAIPGRDGIRRALPHSYGSRESDSESVPPMVGRRRQVNQLLASVREVVSENRPALTTVIAEIGHGKSHLARTLSTCLRDELPAVQRIELRAREPLGIEHDQLLQNLLRATLQLPRATPEDGGRAILSEQLGRELADEVWPAVALVLGWLPADAPEVRRLSAAPAALRSASAQAAGEALRRMTESRPVCCIIDDAHYADETTLDALEYATLAETSAPLWVCVLADPIFERARPMWASRSGHRLKIQLLPLADADAAVLCRRLLHPAKNVPEQVVERLVEWTGGNPLLLIELVGGVKRRGLIRRHARGDAWYLATDELEKLPEMPQVEWLAERELGALDTELADAARLMAILGSEFTVVEVEGVLRALEDDGLGELFPLDAWVSISRLLGKSLLTSRHDGHFEFRHALMRDMVLRTTPMDLRQQIHRAAFRYYRSSFTLGVQYQLRQLAWHAEHSGLVGAAAATYIHLAEQAHHRHAYLDAELAYSRTLELIPPDRCPARMQCYNGRGLMHYRLSRFADALADLEQAMAIADHLNDAHAQVQLLLDQATVTDWMWDFERSNVLVQRAQVIAAAIDSQLLDARLNMALGRALLRAHELGPAKQLLQRSILVSEELENHGYETLVVSLMLLGSIHAFAGDVDEAAVHLDRAVQLCEERGDKLHLAATLNNRRDLWITAQDVDRAADDGLRAQRIGREIGQSQIEYATSHNLAELYYFAGDLNSAWPHLARAIEIEPHNSKKPYAVLLNARLLSYAGRRKELQLVFDQLRRTQDGAREINDKDALFDESRAFLIEAIDLVAHEATKDDWQRMRVRAENSLQGAERAEFLEFMANYLLQQGDIVAARQLLEEAVRVAEAVSHLIQERIKVKLGELSLGGTL